MERSFSYRGVKGSREGINTEYEGLDQRLKTRQEEPQRRVANIARDI